MRSVPWDDRNMEEGDWLARDIPMLSFFREIYHVVSMTEETTLVMVYRPVNFTERLASVFNRTVPLPQCQITQARVVLRNPKGEVLDFNPLNGPTEGLLVWLMGTGKIKDLPIDLKEWEWRATGNTKKAHFFGYTVKKGYRIILDTISKTPPIQDFLTVKGYSFLEKKKFFANLWHP